ncbi:hypothetical protein GJW-30_1_01799 [Variibacter gotjawalensis]|uniref:Lectin-like protein BA14k n=1 Tax=Variibacter gotjawalensis TaxID=1333996 RepID=A0A0S3PTR5_9BRAD|nr:hypothetical protein [Variibacter gotjawalensis]NIK49584.1 hypothetical protein [Variibacter gotjawalensis]RZS45595.1 hypothetical protein EV661_3914 [Variibacter gotjawalensis]BAT59268.1 hypothetical protein GJW-30_1_01799 [Variibacter gotjawalensis]
MKKGLTALMAVGAVGLTIAASMGDADAQRRYRGGSGAGVAAGIIGGIAAGAIIAGATQPRYYEPAPAYGPPPRWCYETQQVWSNRYQDYVPRRVRVPCY